ncbi:unnamed protein product [Mesocestoides corti]|uniref:FAD-binding FR-type domain-containing protein n=2 Tax=Mesocestoides corti TaxID=53468 RepID=A0A0R3UPS7_MESCO|nr:unnamed protein product [Mesocestoides corti]
MVESKDKKWLAIGGVVAGIAVAAAVGGSLIRVFLKKSAKIYLQGQNIKLPLRLVDKEVISADTGIFTFGLPSAEYVLGIPIGGCVQFHARINGENVKRPYTPITLDDLKGYAKFIIKIYRKDVNPKFPAGGKMTQYIDSLEIGDGLEVSGPFGFIQYCGDGVFETKAGNARKLKATHINMVCGGTGLTPMYQLLKHILKSTSDKTKIALVFANHTESDILMRDELEQLRDQNQSQFRIWYTVANPPQSKSFLLHKAH